MVTNAQAIILIGLASLATILNRGFAFIFLNSHRSNKYIVYLGTVLPYTIIALLLVYSMRSLNLMQSPYSLPEISAVIITAVIHYRFKNNLVSIAVGTAYYLILINIIL